MATARIYSAGQLNQRVQLQARAPGETTLGEPDGAWQDVGGPLWAAVIPLRGAERLQAGAAHETMDTLVVIRYRPGITPRMRLLWKGQPLDIVAAVPVDGGTEWLEIQAIAGARDGR